MQNQNIYLVALVTALSGLVFGYDIGILANITLFIKKEFILNENSINLLIGSIPFGAFLAALFSGGLSDKLGRKPLIIVSAIFFLTGSMCCTFASTIDLIVISYFILGVAIGISSCVIPIYTAELTEENQRGKWVNIFIVMIQFGILLSFISGYLHSAADLWRVMIAIGIIPAFAFLYIALKLPESPRWLSMHHAQEKNSADLSFQLRFFKILLIGAALSFFTQMVGISVLNFYSLPQHGIFIGFLLTLSTVASLSYIDKIGRRKPLLFGMSGVLMSLLVIATAFAWVQNPALLGVIIFFATVSFMLSYGLGIAPSYFLIPAEIFPARVRGLGMGISVACNWGTNVLIAYWLPVGLMHYGPVSVFLGFFAISLVGFIVFYLYVPETKNTSLEKIEERNEKLAEEFIGTAVQS